MSKESYKEDRTLLRKCNQGIEASQSLYLAKYGSIIDREAITVMADVADKRVVQAQIEMFHRYVFKHHKTIPQEDVCLDVVLKRLSRDYFIDFMVWYWNHRRYTARS